MKRGATRREVLLGVLCAVAIAACLFHGLKAIRAEQSTPTLAEIARAEPVPRRFYGRRLEPQQDVVLHGAGQSDSESFLAYTHAVAPHTPMLFMTYVDLKDDLPAYFARLRAQLDALPQFAVPQIGLSLNGDNAHHHYEADVASGALDVRLQQLCDGLRSLDRPVFLRPGYEFNGAWNGYAPVPYVAAFRYMVKTVRACGLENVAFVWDWSAEEKLEAHPPHTWSAYYPGDAWVDWWGINLFSSASIASAATQAFLADADAHHFPVMIAESSSQHQPVSQGQLTVDRWFAPYFGLIRRTPGIRAFCYIDWDWGRYPQWSNWGDDRIEQNSVVLAFYRDQLSHPLYAYARDRSSTLALLRTK